MSEQYSHSHHDFSSPRDGSRIHYQCWVPTGETKRVLVIQHGFGEHGGRYGHLLDALAGQGYRVYSIDSRGHGQSEGKRGHTDQFQYYIEDLAELIQIARRENNQQKIYLLGHSLGGVISLQYALQFTNQDNLVALVVSSPALEVVMDAAKHVKKFVGEFLAPLAPSVTVNAGLDTKYLSHDPETVRAYNEDPLVHGKISLQMGKNLFEVGEAVYKNAPKLKVPLYIFHGTGDNITSVAGSKKLFDCAGSPDKKMNLYDGLYHETMNESPESRAKVLTDLKEWLAAH